MIFGQSDCNIACTPAHVSVHYVDKISRERLHYGVGLGAFLLITKIDKGFSFKNLNLDLHLLFIPVIYLAKGWCMFFSTVCMRACLDSSGWKTQVWLALTAQYGLLWLAAMGPESTLTGCTAKKTSSE